MYNYLPKSFSNKGIILYIFLIFFVTILFNGNGLPILWIILGIFSIFFFFHLTHKFTFRWQNLSELIFSRKLFFYAFWLRIFGSLFVNLIFYYYNNQPFEFEAADSVSYHETAIWLSQLLADLNFSRIFEIFKGQYSDLGYPLYLSILYLITDNSIIIVRLIKAVLGAYTVLCVYRIAKRNFGESPGRIAGIFAMLLPNLIYYCSLHTKETEMVFLTIVFINQADTLIRSQSYSYKRLLITVIIGSSLFFFRTVLGIAVFFAMFTAIVFTNSKILGVTRKVFIFIWVGIFALILLGSSIFVEVNQYWEARTNNLESQMSNFSQRKSGNTLAKYGKTAIFAPLIILAPFPTMVNIPGQDNQMMLSGAYFTRNIYAFFVIIALIWLLFHGQYKNHLLLLSFVGVYLAILSMSGFALSERFHMPVVPILLVFAALGVNIMNPRHKDFFIAYLVIVFAIVVGWNWFKLAGRGLL